MTAWKINSSWTCTVIWDSRIVQNDCYGHWVSFIILQSSRESARYDNYSFIPIRSSLVRRRSSGSHGTLHILRLVVESLPNQARYRPKYTRPARTQFRRLSTQTIPGPNDTSMMRLDFERIRVAPFDSLCSGICLLSYLRQNQTEIAQQRMILLNVLFPIVSILT